MSESDTIAAIASAVSSSGIGIIRISGDDAFHIAEKIYRSPSGKKKLSHCKSHTVHYGYIYDEDELIDEVMVLLMKAPKTYTREDCVEIDCHGGVYIMRRILNTVIRYGARPAEPGEFTKRAFLNGRIDLSQAESVIDVINSKNQYALSSSLNNLNGKLKEDIVFIRSHILHEIAYIESALDDPEHMSLDGYPEKLFSIMDSLSKKIEHLLRNSDNGRIINEGIQTVIVGKPNAGKSSILNILVGEDRAIVTDVAGTTRDILEEHINLDGISLNIIDTAGIRETEDIVEKIGVEKTLSKISKADLILYIIDSSVTLDDDDKRIMEAIKKKHTIVLLNKSDLQAVVSLDEIYRYFENHVIVFSAKDHTGLSELKDMIKKLFFDGMVDFNDEVYISNIRQKNNLSEALESLHLVENSIKDGLSEDFFSIDLMNAYKSLGNILGESIDDDLANEIFSKFCMGK